MVLPIAPDLKQNMMITLNGTGAFLWEQLQKETDEDALVNALLDQYDVQEPTARSCVKDFIRQLEEQGFLE